MSDWDDTANGGNWENATSGAVTNSAAFTEPSFTLDEGNDADIDAGGLADTFTCRNCNAEGHMAKECPEPKKMTGECFNCGQVGHNKADCTSPKVDRPFTGTCRYCNEEGHRAADCPSKPAETCRNCGEEGHKAADCEASRKRDFSNVKEMSEAEAMEWLSNASSKKDTDLFKEGVKILVKGNPTLTYIAIEEKLREANLNLFLVGKLRSTPKNTTNVDLQGKQDRKYVVGYCLSPKPQRVFNKNEYPRSAEENLERLAEAGDAMPSLVPVCARCDQKGHTTKQCEQPAPSAEEKNVRQCYNCGGTGHYFRDCKEARIDKSACRNCGGSGHRANDCLEPRSVANVECRKCGEMGHFSRECPTAEGGSGGNRACRNCGEDGHIAKECDKPRDPSTITCRNCDETGHMSRECPKPRDYSRVKCSNCGEMGHTQVRCKAPVADGGYGDAGAVDGGFEVAAGGFDAPPDSNGENSWNDAPASANNGW